ncbi:unnamed protein product [Amoebophrya sp. A25]|nr:unnamed protein product [Amoebophrya sp. A25]|eukprot:GSA25T00018220001.1
MKPPFPIGLSEEQRNLYCQPNADVEEEGTFVFTDLVIELNTLFFKLLDPLQAHGMKIVTLGTALALGTNMALVTFLSPFLFLVLLSLVVVTVLLYVFFNFGFLYVTGFLGPLLAAPVKPPIVPSPGTEEMLRGTDTQQLQGPPHELAGKNNGVHFCYPTELQRTMTSSLTSTNQELHQQNQDDLPRKVQNFMNGLHIFYCKNLCVTWDSEAVLVAVCLVIFLFTTMILLRVIKYRHSAGLALQLLMASTKVLWKVPGLLFFAPVCAIFTGVGCMFLYGCCLGAVFVVPDEYFCNGLVFGVLSGLLRLVLVPVQMILPAEVTSILFTSTQSSGTCSSIAYNSSPFTSTDVAAAHVASWVLRWIAAGLTIGMYEWFRSFMHGTTTTAVADAVVCWFYTYDDGENDEDKDDGNYGVEDDRSKDAKIFDDETDGDLELELEDLQQENGHHVAPCEYHGHEDDKNDDEQDNQGPLTAETQRLLRLRNESHGVDEEEEEAVVVNVSKSPREACHRAESPTSTKRSTPRSEHRDHHGCYEAEEQVPCLVESATASEDGEPDRGIHDHCEDEEPLIMEEERSGKRNDKWVEGQHRVSLVTTAGSEEIQGRDDNVTLECDEADGREVVVLDKPRGPKSRTCLFSGTTTKSTTSKKCGAAPRHLIWRFFIAPFGFLILWVRVLFRFSGAIAMGAFFHSFYRLIQFVAGFDWTGTSKTHFILLALAVVPISKIYVYMALDNQTSFSGACRTALGVLSRHPSQWLMLEAITHSLSFICYTGVFVVVLIASLVTHPDAAAQTNVTRYLQKTAESGPCLVNEVLLQMRFPFASEDYACDAKSGSSSAGSSTSTSAAGGAPGAAAAGTAGNQGNINHGNGSWGSPGAVISGGVAQVAQAEQGNNAKEKDEKGKETKERQKDWRGWLQLLSRRGRSDTWVYPLLNLVIALFFTHEILKVYGIAVDALYVCCLRDWDEHGQKLSNTSRLRQLKMLKLQKAFRRVFAQERRGRFS